MTAFDKAFEHTLGFEGGYTKDPSDKGNWTGGQIGQGELKGTKFGISAMAYPSFDIENLTVDQAKEVYRRDYWNPLGLDRVEDTRLSMKLFDMGVNMGLTRTIKILQAALNYLLASDKEVAEDGKLGPATLVSINAVKSDRLLMAICGEAYVFYRSLVQSQTTHQYEKYAGGWLVRAMWIPTS